MLPYYPRTVLMMLSCMLVACVTQAPVGEPVIATPGSAPIPGALPAPPEHSRPAPTGNQKPAKLVAVPIKSKSVAASPVPPKTGKSSMEEKPLSAQVPEPEPEIKVIQSKANALPPGLLKDFPWLNACLKRVKAGNALQCDADSLLAQASARVMVYVRDPKLAKSASGGARLREGLPHLYRFYVLP